MLKKLLLVACWALPANLIAQTMSVEEYSPKSSLVVPQHPIARAKYPIIDIHNHQNSAWRRASWISWCAIWIVSICG